MLARVWQCCHLSERNKEVEWPKATRGSCSEALGVGQNIMSKLVFKTNFSTKLVNHIVETGYLSTGNWTSDVMCHIAARHWKAAGWKAAGEVKHANVIVLCRQSVGLREVICRVQFNTLFQVSYLARYMYSSEVSSVKITELAFKIRQRRLKFV